MSIQYYKLPGLLGPAMKRYVEEGIKPGSFLECVLVNDLAGTIGRADPVSLARINEIVSFIQWELPGDCHGSPAAYQAWIEKGGLNGTKTKRPDWMRVRDICS